MVKKLTYEFVNQYVKDNGCELIDNVYINANTKLNYFCQNRHKTFVTFGSFKKGSRCIDCSGNKKYTFDYVKQYFKDNDCKLLETEYKNSYTKLNYICKNDHKTSIIFSSFKQGIQCNICSSRQKKTFEFIKNDFEINGYKLLDTEYKNTKNKLNYICKNGHKALITFKNFKKGNRCLKCSGKEKFTYEFVKQYFKDNGCKLLETEYKNNRTKMSYLCKNEHKALITLSSFQQGDRCGECSGNKKHTYKYVKEFFKSNKYELLETEYINALTKMKFKCNNNHKSVISFNNLQQGIRCGKCKNKTEVLVLEHLELNYQNIIFQPSFDWCKIKKKLPFDFLLTDFHIILEIDGIQHFKNVSNWQSAKLNLENDIYKANLAINNGYKIIRISQEDVFNNKFNWKDLLKESIEKLIKSEDNIIYLSNDANLYNKHKFELTKKILENKLKYKI